MTWQAKLAGLAILALIFGGMAWSIRSLRAQVSELTVERDACARDLTSQNDAIEALRDLEVVRARDAASAVAAARIEARAHESRAKRILSAQPKSQDACQAAETLIREELWPSEASPR